MLEGKLRLKLLDEHGDFLGEEVEIRLSHRKLTDLRVSRVVASEEVVLTGLHAQPVGLYLLEVRPRGFFPHGQFVDIKASGFTDISITFRRRKGKKPPGPYEPDAVVDALEPAEVRDAIRLSLGAAAGDGGQVEAVVWTDLGDEVLVHLGSLRLEVEDGVIRSHLDLECDQTGRQTLEVTFALGNRREDGVMVVATEELPLGHPGLAARWGRSVQTAIWEGVLAVARERAHQAEGVPGRVWIEGGQILFETSQAPSPTVKVSTLEAPR